MVAKRGTSLGRGTAILIALGSDEALERDGLGVVRIAELVGTEKSQVSRALSTLAAGGLVDRDPDSRSYRLGWRLFALAARSGRPRLVALAAAFLQRLVAAVGRDQQPLGAVLGCQHGSGGCQASSQVSTVVRAW